MNLNCLYQCCMNPGSQAFTKLCKLVYPWESVSEIQSIKEPWVACIEAAQPILVCKCALLEGLACAGQSTSSSR